MSETKLKKQAEFTLKHTLTNEDLRKMIAEKLERAKAYKSAQKKREAFLEDR